MGAKDINHPLPRPPLPRRTLPRRTVLILLAATLAAAATRTALDSHASSQATTQAPVPLTRS